MAKKLPEYNASSLADIAFMLLIFFLVTTTMDVDSGLRRKLPPPPPPDQVIDNDNRIKERNIFEVLVNSNNQLLVEGELTPIRVLREKTKEFMANPANKEDLPEKEIKEVEFFGQVPVTRGVISLRNHVGTTYDIYLQVQNELVGAINELREELARSKWGKNYADLDREHQNAIRIIFPSKISEAEPKRRK